MKTQNDTEPRSEDPENFLYPLDDAFSFEARKIGIRKGIAVYLRDSDGSFISHIDYQKIVERDFNRDEYIIELSGPIKTYLKVDSPVSVTREEDTISLDFDSRTGVYVGVRSRHRRPEATITTTSDPEDMMDAVSQFSSALKTTSPERSFPNLRGHPPRVEMGDTLRIPNELKKPETGVRIEVPRNHESVYAVSSLSYYLGANVVPGPNRITTDEGFEYDLGSGPEFEREVGRILKQVFLLDCVTRTEGLYPVNLHERNLIEDRVSLDFAELYDFSLARRLEEYLSVSYTTIEGAVPKWKKTVYVEPESSNFELLPFLVDDLSTVRSSDPDAADSRISFSGEAVDARSSERQPANLRTRGISSSALSQNAYED